jgi:pimeloyl-ACP methyl ester carboxylesterase
MDRGLQFDSYDGTYLDGTFMDGAADAEALVLMVHGITSNRDEFGLFGGLAELLASHGIPSLRFDYRCHGAAMRPMESMTLAGVLNDIEAAAAAGLARSGRRRVHVVGMSFGGGLSALWASRTRQDVASVVMFAPVIDYEEDILGQHGGLSGQTVSDDVATALREDGYVEMDGVRYGAALINELPHLSAAAGLRLLKCDSLILHGDADSVVPFESSARFAKTNDRCRLITIEGTDHGFGEPDDEDLSTAKTKAHHRRVFNIVLEHVRTHKR